MDSMERTLSPDERIKRAEEIYYRRKMQGTHTKSTRVNIYEKKDFGLFRKMLLQIIICMVIYVIFYMIQNTDYIFSEDVIKKANEILSYDINIKNLYEEGMKCINSFIKNNEIVEESNPTDIDNSENMNTENTDEKENNISQEENIGGESVEENKEENTNLSQMEQDAKYILENKSLIIPLKGTITSRYGPRNPTNPKVPKNHTGIDIAVNEGTVFIASMTGTVELVSSKR